MKVCLAPRFASCFYIIAFASLLSNNTNEEKDSSHQIKAHYFMSPQLSVTTVPNSHTSLLRLHSYTANVIGKNVHNFTRSNAKKNQTYGAAFIMAVNLED